MLSAKNSEVVAARKGIVRFGHQGKVGYGLWEKGRLRPFQGSPFSGGQPGDSSLALDEVKLLAPCRPSKVVAVGLNYKEHAREMKKELPTEPLLFMKPSTSLIGPGEYIVMPPISQRVDHECELGVVLGRRCYLVSPEEAGAYILGYTCLNDVTARDLQAKDGQYTRGKGFDTFCPLGPIIAQDIDPGNLAVSTKVDGNFRQDGHTSDLIFSVFELVSFISQVMTLHPGDVIATGTPSGVGPLAAGQVVTVEVEGVGRLENPIKARG
ncbi:MAG: fumarylacetoacetate hydrolase family protein [Deltaproteobacteria bacterium]|nr:fumarylacetoacetate hydrolase family protein [Deltaproteobacteria bacterium]